MQIQEGLSYPCGASWDGHGTNFALFSEHATGVEYVKSLGVITIELMPTHTFVHDQHLLDGSLRNYWGYNSIGFFAPHPGYAGDVPSSLREFKEMVARIHDAGLEIILDVVYNHFGPDGNCLPRYAPQFFTDRHQTPWGNAINYDGEGSGVVREFFIDNARYTTLGEGAVAVTWDTAAGTLMLAANQTATATAGFPLEAGEPIWQEGDLGEGGRLGPWAVRWSLQRSPVS